MKTISSLKHASLCAVGIVMMKANMSSIKVLKALYVKARQGNAATDFSL